MHLAQTALRLREQMCAFLGNLPVCKTSRRFALEALYGIQQSQSLMLSRIARALGEKIALIKTEGRLSRQAGRPGLDQAVEKFVIEQGACRIGQRTLLVIDPSDIAKPYAEKMEYLARVRDGSKGELANGYWLCQVVGVECGGQEIVPLVNRLWSQKAPDFRSENAQVLSCISAVVRRVGSDKGIWVMDRGGDRMKLYRAFLRLHVNFIVRLIGNRDLIYNGCKRPAEAIAAQCPTPYAETIWREKKDGTEQAITLEFGYREVRLPGFARPLWLLVVKGFGEKPLLILTTLELRKKRQVLWWVIEAYLTRWRIEDTLRFAKQSYDLEDVRVLGYQSLKNMMAMALLAMYFSMVYLGQQTKLAILCHHALAAGKRLFGIPDFRYYAIADGIRTILASRQRPAFDFTPTSEQNSTQADMLDLFGAWVT
jgi:hypothetical protein